MSHSMRHVTIDETKADNEYERGGLIKRAKPDKLKRAIPRHTLGDIATGKGSPKTKRFNYSYDLGGDDEDNVTSPDSVPPPVPARVTTEEKNEAVEMIGLHTNTAVTGKPKNYQNNLKKLKTAGVLIDQHPMFRDVSPDELTTLIVNEFNSHVRPGKDAYVSAVGWWTPLYADIERVGQNKVLLATRNEVPQIFGHQKEQLIKNTKFYNPTISIDKIDIFDLNETHIGYGGAHYLNIKPGFFGLGMLDNSPVIYNHGIHIIHGKFTFEKVVSQKEIYIHHADIHILRIPPGKLGLIRLGQVYMIIEASENPYVYLENDFEFFKCVDVNVQLIRNGTYQRLTPKVNEVVLISDNGALEVMRTEPDKQHIILDGPYKEVLAFVTSDKQTRTFPTVEKDKGGMQYIFRYRGEYIEIKINTTYQVTDPQKFLELNLRLNPFKDNVMLYVENVILTALGILMDPSKTKQKDLAIICKELELNTRIYLAAGGIELHEVTLRQSIANNRHFRLAHITPTSKNQAGLGFFKESEEQSPKGPLVKSRSDNSIATTASRISAESSDNGAPTPPTLRVTGSPSSIRT
jgi:hypothetical protein